VAGACSAGEAATPPLDTTLPLFNATGHADGVTPSGVERVPPTECPHDSFRYPTVLLAGDRNGDVSHPRVRQLTVAADRGEQPRGGEAEAWLRLSGSSSLGAGFAGGDRCSF
jgi:hypothetical protein